MAAQLSATLMEIFERRTKEMEEYYQMQATELQMTVRHRDRRIEDLQELVALRDAAVKSLLKSIGESNLVIDQLRNDKKLMQKEKNKLQQRIGDLERRPEPLPCGLPSLTRAALEQVMKWDAEPCIAEQKKTICQLGRSLKHTLKENATLEDNLAAAEATIDELRGGKGINMNEAWGGMFDAEGRQPLAYFPWHYSPRPLHDFLGSLDHEFLKRNHQEYLNRQEGEDEEEDESNRLLPNETPA